MYFRDENEFKERCGYTIDNVWYPRVTKIVEIKAKPALYKFYAEMGNHQEGEKVKTRSAAEGTLIHETFEKILVGQEPTVDPSIAPAIAAAREFLEHNHILVDSQFVEKRIVNHQHRYAGTIDALALIDGAFGVLDIKTSQSIYRDYNLQTAAYVESLQEQLRTPPRTRWIMRIDQIRNCQRCGSTRRVKGGRDKIRRPYPAPAGWQGCAESQHQWSDLTGVVELKEFPFWQDDFAAFLGAKRLWEWENVYWLKKIGY